MRKYKSFVPCGFCMHHGSVFTEFEDDICRDCEIHRIRSALETLENAVIWEHDHKYRADTEEEVHNCAHCKHALAINNRYHCAQYGDNISCHLDRDNLDDDNCYPTRSALSFCDKWERARDLSKEGSYERT